MNTEFLLFVENLTAALRLSLQLLPFVGCIWAFAIRLGLDAVVRGKLLRYNTDGKTMALFGLAWVFISGFCPNGISLTAAASFGTVVATLGVLIWLDDTITNALFGKWSWGVYLLGAAASYWAGIGNNTIQLGENAIGLSELALPTLGVALLGFLAVIALLTRRFTDILLPQDTSGFRLMGIGVIVLLVAVFNLNPIALVCLSVVGTSVFSLGLLMALPAGWTEFLVYRWWMALPYAFVAFVIFLVFM